MTIYISHRNRRLSWCSSTSLSVFTPFSVSILFTWSSKYRREAWLNFLTKNSYQLKVKYSKSVKVVDLILSSTFQEVFIAQLMRSVEVFQWFLLEKKTSQWLIKMTLREKMSFTLECRFFISWYSLPINKFHIKIAWTKEASRVSTKHRGHFNILSQSVLCRKQD